MNILTEISNEVFCEVSELVDKALSASTKQTAGPYIIKLNSLYRFGAYSGHVNIVFGELVAFVKSASGRVANKERLRDAAMASLCKLQGQVSDDNNNDVATGEYR